MVLFDDAFYVKAFAGPGVELFTVARDKERRADVLHIEGLADRIDIKRVGSDIHRVYLVTCPKPHPAASPQRCTVNGEPLEERYDDRGHVVKRVFPSAHGIGLTVTYEDYAEMAGRTLPKKITLHWGNKKNKMMIVMLSAEPADGDEKAVLNQLLQSP